MILLGKAVSNRELVNALARCVFPAGAALLSVLVLLVFGGCSQKEQAGRVAAKKPRSARNAIGTEGSSYIKEYSRRLEALLAPVEYSYDPGGKPDPFQPFVRGNVAPAVRKSKVASRKTKSIAGACASPLECMDVGQLTLVAVIEKKGGERVAMAQDAAGIGYFLKKGTRIGFHEGEVVAVLPDRVKKKKKGEDIVGRPIVKERVLVLHPEEE